MPKDSSKIEIAQIQLDAAITGLFNGAHLVVVHTLSGAASRILSDLVEATSPEDAWHTKAIEANKLTSKEYFDVIRATSNAMKHADRDTHAITSLEPEDVELSLWMALYDLTTLKALSPKCEIYQLWCFARYPTILAPPAAHEMQKIVETSQAYFGDLAKLSREAALTAGRRRLEERHGYLI